MSRAHGRRGFTVLEVMISLTIMGLVISSVALLGLSNQRAYRTGAAGADLEVDVRRALDQLVQEFMRSGASVLLPDPEEGVGGSDVTYAKAVGTAGGVTTWSSQNRVRFDYEEGELDDGADNNGNGLVDEGRLIWTRDVGGPNEKTHVLCHGVSEYLEGEELNLDDDNGNGLEDERGFCLERVGEALVIRLTLEHQVSGEGLQARTIETSVKLRN
jgi:prepilin-type N-terminal cleavage/methylation domain-containing protein